MNDLTTTALLDALENNKPLTTDQRATLYTIVVEHKRSEDALAAARAEAADYLSRWEAERQANISQISGGRYPDGQPAW